MKTQALAAAVSDLAALLDYAGQHREALSLRGEVTALSHGRSRARRFNSRVRGGIFTLRQAVPPEARLAADEVVTRINRALSDN
jgi:hypothetical protein